MSEKTFTWHKPTEKPKDGEKIVAVVDGEIESGWYNEDKDAIECRPLIFYWCEVEAWGRQEELLPTKNK